MALGAPTAAPSQVPPPGLMQMITTLAAGAGFKNVSEGTKKLSESGTDLQQMMMLPNMPMFLAGAGIRDLANSMDIIGPLMKMFQPPLQPQNQPGPEQMAAAMQMLSARLGPGLTGIRPPMPVGMPGVPGPGMPIGAPGPMSPPGMMG